jgi:hypothetical protein
VISSPEKGASLPARVARRRLRRREGADVHLWPKAVAGRGAEPRWRGSGFYRPKADAWWNAVSPPSNARLRNGQAIQKKTAAIRLSSSFVPQYAVALWMMFARYSSRRL